LSGIGDVELREATLDIFDKLRSLAESHHIDTCVLAARRLSCLYLVLLNAGMAPLPCEVFGDRDMDVQAKGWWSGKRVALVDDSVVVGSTMAFLAKQLRELVTSAGEVRTLAVCLNEEQQAPALIEFANLEVGLRLPDCRVVAYSEDLAKVLHRNLMPYFGDFVFTHPQQWNATELTEASEARRWIVADVTSSRIADELTSSYSLVPRACALRDIRSRLGQIDRGLVDSLMLCKVRMFVRMRGFQNEVRLVPVTVLKPSKSTEVDRTFANVFLHLGSPQEMRFVVDGNWAAAKQRLLQVFCSLFVLQALQQDLGRDGKQPLSLRDVLDDRATLVNFGPALAPIVEQFCERVGHDELRPPSIHVAEDDVDIALSQERESDMQLASVKRIIGRAVGAVNQPSPPEPRKQLYLGQSTAGLIAQLFSYIDGAFERPERIRIRGMTIQDFFHHYPTSGDRRLNRGLLLEEIAGLLRDGVCDDSWALILASFVIDVCNDVGIAVPVTQEVPARGVVERRFRIGENSRLAAFPFDDVDALRHKGDMACPFRRPADLRRVGLI